MRPMQCTRLVLPQLLSETHRSWLSRKRSIGTEFRAALRGNLAAFGDQRRHDFRRLAATLQSCDDTGPIHGGTILADLPLTFDPIDRDFHADDALHLRH